MKSKSKYVTLVFISCAMFFVCYSTAMISSSASKYVVESPAPEESNDTYYTDDASASSEATVGATFNTASPTEDTDSNKDDLSSSDDKSDTDNKNSPVSETEAASRKPEATKSPTKKPATTNTPTKKPVTTKAPTKKPSPTQDTSYENAPIKIPTIYAVSAPGKTVLTSANGDAIMDASNISKGYIAVKYIGSNKKVKVQFKYKDQTYNYDLASDRKYDYFPFQLGNGTYTVKVLENISGTQYRIIQTESIDINLTNKNAIFLYPNQYVWFTQSSNVVKKSAQVCANQNTTLKKISAIFKYVTSHVKYDYNKAENVQSGYLPDVDKILKSGKGICFDYAALFAAMCRAQGIPTKLITGYVSPSGTYHAWNEVYTKEKGWITVSFYLKTSGFNLVDPTFYSNMDDKEAAEYIGNGGNYKNYHIY